MRESADVKGRRYLGEGRLTVKRVSGGVVEAVCRGTGSVHACGFDGSGWWCDCEARSTCSHLVALQLVVVSREPVRAAAFVTAEGGGGAEISTASGVSGDPRSRFPHASLSVRGPSGGRT